MQRNKWRRGCAVRRQGLPKKVPVSDACFLQGWANFSNRPKNPIDINIFQLPKL